jgi:small nuclear ribonucleoprotein (snRNP)-like protein
MNRVWSIRTEELGDLMDPSKIVARYRDGRTLKGTTQNFFPTKPVFHVKRLGGAGPGDLVEVNIEDLKAIFFVRDFTGNKTHVERKKLAQGDRPQGRMMEVTCKDGEVIVGTTTGYDPKRPGFFLFPIDLSANNARVYMVASAVRTARFL